MSSSQYDISVNKSASKRKQVNRHFGSTYEVELINVVDDVDAGKDFSRG
jgi:hypothetical protein